MGRQTGVVLAGFVALHVALIVNLVSLTTNNWLESPTFNTTTQNNTNSTNETSKGLWKKCELGDCFSIMDTFQPRWFHAVQGLFTCGVLLTFSALVQFYLFLMIPQLKRNKLLQGSVTLDSLLATLTLFSALVIFGVLAPDRTEDMIEPRTLAWSFWVGAAGLVATVVAFLLQCREACLLRERVLAYQDI